MRNSKGRDDLFRSSNNRSPYSRDEVEYGESDSFINNQVKMKQEKIQDQDTIIDQLHQSVARFGAQTREMKNEIEDHLGLINSMESDLEKNQNALEYVNTRATKMIERSGGETRVICILSGIVFILFLLVIYS